jgi:hypothetical protein
MRSPPISFSEALHLAANEDAPRDMHDNLCGLCASPSSFSDFRTEAVRDEDKWYEIINEDFSDNDSEFPAEDSDAVLLPAGSPAVPRTVWEVLADRLVESSFDAKFVDPAQRELNMAAVKKRYQLDPTKRHTWTSKCGRYQVAGYFNLYAKGMVGLFTEDGFPVYVKLDELSDADIRFVLNKLGEPLRSKVEAQLRGKPAVTHMEYSTDDGDNQAVREASVTTMNQGGKDEELKYVTCKGDKEFGETLGKQATNRLLEDEEESTDKGRRAGGSRTAFGMASPSCETISARRSTNTQWTACDAASGTSAAAQMRASADGSVLEVLQAEKSLVGPRPPDTRLAGPDVLGLGPRFAEDSTVRLEKGRRLVKMYHLRDLRRGT